MPEPPAFSDPASEETGDVRLRASRSAGPVVAAAVRLALAEARALGAAVLAVTAPMVLLAAAVRVVGAGAGAASGADAAGTFVDLAASVLLNASVLAFVRLYRRGAARAVADVWAEAAGVVGPVLRVTVLAALGLVAVAFPVVLAASVVGALAGPAAAAVVALVGLVAVLVVAVPLVSLASAAAALDGVAAGEAFRRAAGLARTDARLVAGTTAVAVVLFGAVLAAVAAALAATVGIGALDAPGPTSAAAGAALTLATLPVSVVFSLVWVVLYGSLVARAEGADLDADVAAIASGGETRGEPEGRP